MTIHLQLERREATPAEADEALAQLDHDEGLYFGVDAGIAGLHPLQALLVTVPALRLRLWGDGLEVQALTPFGLVLLAQPELAGWLARTGRGGEAALALARDFLGCFESSADILLAGPLPFAAHRLRARGGAQAEATGAVDEPLGVLYFPERMLRREGGVDGGWRSVSVSLAGAGGAARPGEHAREPASSGQVGHGMRRDDVQIGLREDDVPPVDDLPPGGYAEMVGRAVELLRERPLVSLTLSQSYRRRVEMAPTQAFARLRAANPAPASFFVNDGAGTRLFGASPDLQLVVGDGNVQALPVCGTVARRPGAQGEAESLRELFNEEVDAAALAVCSDALRNDLAPLCEPGTLRLLDRRRPMSLATVVHAVDRLSGRLRLGADAWDAIAATAAPVMLTGTPRALAVQAIAELEASPRGWYGGMMVQVSSNGDALVGTILRAACVRGGVAEVRAGGDLLADSSPEREEAESRLKTRSLWRAFGLEQAPAQGTALQAGAVPPSVRLLATDDPFEAGLLDSLGALGLSLDEASPLAVLAGNGLPEPLPEAAVAIGDAAYRLLAQCGVPVRACHAEHGRALQGETTADAPMGAGHRFTAGRYASFTLECEPGAGWRIWARDDAGMPLALARDRHVCLLLRPDSLLSDEGARALLAAALSAAAAAQRRAA